MIRTMCYAVMIACCGCMDVFIPPTSRPAPAERQSAAEAPVAKPQAVETDVGKTPVKVLIIGDSISMENIGYFNNLKVRLGDGYEVVHNPENGGTSLNVLTHLDEWVTATKPDVIHFNCGLHDLRSNFGDPTPNQSPESYERHLQEIVNYLKTRTQARLVFALTTPTNEEWHKRKGFDRFEASVRKYNDIARGVMTQNNIPMNDLYTLVVNAGVNDCLVPDGVHMNDRGKELCSDAVAAAIEAAAVNR